MDKRCLYDGLCVNQFTEISLNSDFSFCLYNSLVNATSAFSIVSTNKLFNSVNFWPYFFLSSLDIEDNFFRSSDIKEFLPRKSFLSSSISSFVSRLSILKFKEETILSRFNSGIYVLLSYVY